MSNKNFDRLEAVFSNNRPDWKVVLENVKGVYLIIDERGLKYAKENFKLSPLEYRPMRTDDEKIIERGNYWKEAFLSRGKFGYNKNYSFPYSGSYSRSRVSTSLYEVFKPPASSSAWLLSRN